MPDTGLWLRSLLPFVVMCFGGFMALLAPGDIRRLLAGVVLAAIGPVTAATVAEYGLEAAVMPREYTIPALAAAIAAYFADPA